MSKTYRHLTHCDRCQIYALAAVLVCMETRTTVKADVYFAKSYQSWQRGLNEHTNGPVRQYAAIFAQIFLPENRHGPRG